DEELAAVGVGAGVGHRQDARLVVARFRMELVGEVEAGAAGALPERVAPLDHETVDDPMKDDAVVERGFPALAALRVAPFLAALDQSDEVGDGIGRLLVEEADLEVSLRGLEFRVSGHSSSQPGRLSP